LDHIKNDRQGQPHINRDKDAGQSQRSEPEEASHKVHKYLEYHSVCPLVRIGTPPPPLPQASVSPLGTKGGKVIHTRLRVRGWGSPPS
jgi:hypothetical protein